MMTEIEGLCMEMFYFNMEGDKQGASVLKLIPLIQHKVTLRPAGGERWPWSAPFPEASGPLLRAS